MKTSKAIKAFFNFIRNSIDRDLQNPCDSPILNKTFKAAKKPAMDNP